MSSSSKHLFVLICLISAVNSFAQTSRSPFSRQGLGELYGSALINSQGMGGVGVSQPQFLFLNSQNPALLVNNTLTVFQIGIVGENKTLRQDTLSEKSSGGNLNYLVTAFPIKPTRWTTSLGLMPYSSVNYKVNYYDLVQFSSDSIFVSEDGSGGLTELYWANGVKLFKDFSVGLRASYLFGSISNKNTNQRVINGVQFGKLVTVEEKSVVKDFGFTAGVAYSIDSLGKGDRYRFNVGATYGFESDLNTTLRLEEYASTAGGAEVSDTLSTTKGTTSLPAALTAGISFGYGYKWTIGTDFHYQDWSTFRSINQNAGTLGKSWKINFGGEYTPDVYSESYVKRITYRLGGSFEQTPFLVNKNSDVTAAPINAQVKDLGINFGLSLPAGNSSLDLAFRFGKRGNKSETYIDETYFRIFFGITFNDRWFVKRKFD